MFTLPCRHRAIHEKTRVHTKEEKSRVEIHTSTRIIPDRHTGIYVNKRVYNIQRGTKTDKIYLSTQYPGTRVPVPVGTSTLPGKSVTHPRRYGRTKFSTTAAVDTKDIKVGVWPLVVPIFHRPVRLHARVKIPD